MLPGCDDRDGDGEELCESTGDGAEGELGGGGEGGVWAKLGEIEGAHESVPVEVGEVGGGDANERADHAGVEAGGALL